MLPLIVLMSSVVGAAIGITLVVFKGAITTFRWPLVLIWPSPERLRCFSDER
jgi:hypothetical protein